VAARSPRLSEIAQHISGRKAAHTARDPGVLAKQDLHWTLPQLATPEQAER
jgi:hypothetical protein